MKIIKEVKPIEVKRTFVIADHVAHIHNGKRLGNNRFPLKDISEKEFENRLQKIKHEILNLKEDALDTLVCPQYPKRVETYNKSRWFIAEIPIHELGCWKCAGDLPLRWTNHSLLETAAKVVRGLKRNSPSINRRAKHAIPNILKIKAHLEQREKYLYPIVFKGGTGTMGRKRLKRQMIGDIDDGNMRSIALAVGGRKSLLVYFGVPI